ncbi:hypothetical protein D3C74_279020 [compost metagenome]
MIDVKFLQNDMRHGHGQRGVRAYSSRQPDIGKFLVFRIIRTHADDLGPVVAGLHHKMSVRGTGLRDVSAPNNKVFRIVPISALRHIRLIPPHLRGSRREIGVPVIEAQYRSADQREEPSSCRIADHRHCRNRAEANHAVRPVLADRMNGCSRDHLAGDIPIRADETTLAPRLNIAGAFLRIVHDILPGDHRILNGRHLLAPHLV